MALNKKKVREIIGFSFSQQGSDSENWFKIACAFNVAAKQLHGQSEPITYYFNAGLSIELILKATILANSKSYKTDHDLCELCKKADIKLSSDQMFTLELLSEIIVWSGRYPTPTKEEKWDRFHEVILEKHIIRESKGNVGRTIAHKDRFPSFENYLKIWTICESSYKSAVGHSV